MRFFLSLSFFIAFAVSAIALTVTTPMNNDKLDLSKKFTIKWTTVNSDPERASIFLINSNGHNIRKRIAEDVKISKSEFTLEPIWGVPAANGYQFNFISEKKDNTGILAQSSQFNLTKVGEPPKTGKDCSSISTSSSSSSCTTHTTKTTRPCTNHHNTSSSTSSSLSSPSLSSPSPPSYISSDSIIQKTPTPTATEAASTPTTETGAASKLLAIPTIAGALIMSLLALTL